MNRERHETTRVHKRERKTNRFTMRVSDSELAELNKLSYEKDEPISQIVRRAIKTYIADCGSGEVT